MNDTLDLFGDQPFEENAEDAAANSDAASPDAAAPLMAATIESDAGIDLDAADSGLSADDNGDGAPPAEPPAADEPPPGYSENELILRERYLEYAMSVVLGRALPGVSDGQKPVQRRVLFSMYRLGLAKSPTHVKSARIVGDVIGKYHPHGDSSVYEAMVRTAQDFTLRYPLVDGQGNFGSRDGDNAAAMRYTEARLAPIAELLLAEIDEDTVDFRPNYDGRETEPAWLPARLPFALLNGAKGIAVGMATDMPSHNLREVGAALISRLRPDASGTSGPRTLPGPDFATGGQIISSAEEITAIYATGRGSVRVRARWTVEHLARGQWQLVINELPPEVSTAKISTEIFAATDPAPKEKNGKKFFTPEQTNLKTAMLTAIETVRDESDKKHPVRLVIEPKSSRQKPEELIRLLLAHTSLEVNVSLNLTMIGTDGRPQTKSLDIILDEWLAFRLVTVRRRSAHRLKKAEQRIHILEGRQAILLNIDKAIKVIRHSDDPKADLMKAFKLSEIQAEDILEIRLRQLARLEGIKIGEELARLREDALGLQKLLDDETALRAAVADEIDADVARYGDERRTLIEAAEKVTAADAAPVVNEAVTAIISKAGWVRTRGGHDIDTTALSFKTGDSLLTALPCRTVDHLVVLDSKGRAYSVPVASLPGGRGDGVPLSTLIDYQDGGKLADVQAGKSEKKLLVARSDGYGFIATLADMLSRGKAGKTFLTLDEGVKPMPLLAVDAVEKMACFTNDGRVLVIGTEEVKVLPKGKGVKLIDVAGKAMSKVVPMLDGRIEGIPGTRIEMLSGQRGGKGRKASGK